MDRRIGCHTDANSDTPIGVPRWIERRNITRKCRLPKPAILRTIDALPDDLTNDQRQLTHARARPAGRAGRFLPARWEHSTAPLIGVRSDR